MLNQEFLQITGDRLVSCLTSFLTSLDYLIRWFHNLFCCRPFLQNDKLLLKKILAGMQSHRPDEVQNIILRRHIQELTASFMIPLERYIASLMPLQRDVNPCKVCLVTLDAMTMDIF